MPLYRATIITTSYIPSSSNGGVELSKKFGIHIDMTSRQIEFRSLFLLTAQFVVFPFPDIVIPHVDRFKRPQLPEVKG